MLAAIDFDNEVFGVANKVSNVTIDANLATEMSTWSRKAMPQMPPKFQFSFRWRVAHRARKRALRQYSCGIGPGPDSLFYWLIAF